MVGCEFWLSCESRVISCSFSPRITTQTGGQDRGGVWSNALMPSRPRAARHGREGSATVRKEASRLLQARSSGTGGVGRGGRSGSLATRVEDGHDAIKLTTRHPERGESRGVQSFYTVPGRCVAVRGVS
ncbi:hypothetical protein AMAG_19158 [Allomyces macrogynus ATCC 38327]|uniref:Uncharacterized protein n=1 Tax=Allomyces macrogynus (strain ATCC 38327) TaxID=578462 RepID=A0A0L0SPG9_ALLM3|nr:hypothetical protein AMAG_19158 [Allomyces macrogynus ATCC 38327]|eukprot:KNE64416.1 hypothetical protein AMAG_19158 [Allomyces macrogynus ATCC 38327]